MPADAENSAINLACFAAMLPLRTLPGRAPRWPIRSVSCPSMAADRGR